MDIIQQEKAYLLSSHLHFTRCFFKLKTGRDFELSHPQGRQPHFITISHALEQVFDGKIKRLIINVPPRYGKTTLMIYFVAWAYANYPDSNFIYVSYAKSLAKTQTQEMRELLMMPAYRKLFRTELSPDTTAKDDWRTIHGGCCYAVGAGGSITGRGGGLKNVNRFGGAIIIDDIHKPSEVTSDTIRGSVNDWYANTLMSRINDKNTPIIAIGQRLHEDDLLANLIASGNWTVLSLPALDAAGNALYPEMHDKQALLKMKEEQPYVFASQYQQDPQPAGGGIFKPEWFSILDKEPEIIETFITCDTAETDKDYNDATAFSFWGIYKIRNHGVDTDLYGLHWLDNVELRIEPKDLEGEFFSFYADCMRYRVKPKFVAIEKKSTGVTLTSVLKNTQGLRIIEIERTRASGNKTARFLEAQMYVAQKRISFTNHARHMTRCIEHCRKITANDTHAHDDIADTMYDAIKLTLIDNILLPRANSGVQDKIVQAMATNFSHVQNLRDQRNWG